MSEVKTVAFIPARGGSKGISRKNIKEIAGHPLIYWVCKAALDCELIQEVFVSTEDTEIAYYIYDVFDEKITVIDRDLKHATDEASLEPLVLDFINLIHDFDNIVLIQPTSPLLTSFDLYEALREYNQNKYDSMLSVVKQWKFIWQGGKPWNYSPFDRPRRQDWDGMLVENGAFYITKRSHFLHYKCRLGGKRIGIHEMGSDTYYELDNLADWAIVEMLLKTRLKKQK